MAGLRMLRFYRQFIRPGDLCFDIGAHLGGRTSIFLKLGGRVVAVEPQERCMQQLRRKYGSNRRLTLLQIAIGEAEGKGELMLCDSNTQLSSMSKEWIESVTASGRFSGFRWEKTRVSVATLDMLISEWGQPAFCRIDVDGFELHVLKGLSRPIRAISFEFVPEVVESTLRCIDYLRSIGKVHFNYSAGKQLPTRLALPAWVQAEDISNILVSLPRDKTIYGDVYARFIL